MSIASELSTLIDNKAAIKTAISAKSPTIPPTDVLSQWPTSIASIPSGQEEPWHGNWLELDFDFDQFPYASRTITFRLIETACTIDWGDGSAITTISQMSNYISHTFASGIQKPIVKVTPSTERFTTGYAPLNPQNDALVAIKFPKAWDSSVDYTRDLGNASANVWTNVYFPPVFKMVLSGTGDFGNFIAVGKYISNAEYFIGLGGGYGEPLKFLGTEVFLGSNCSKFVRAQSRGYNGIAFINCTNRSMRAGVNVGLFDGFRQLREIKGCEELVFEAGTASQIFRNCSSLRKFPDTLDMSQCTAITQSFISCTSVKSLPSHVLVNVSISFANLTGITDKGSVATFTNGAITGGFVYNLNTCPNSGQKITFNSQIKALFDATEQAAVEAALNAKNWSLAW